MAEPAPAPTPTPPLILAPAGSPSDPSILAHVQGVWDRIRPDSAIYGILLSEIRLVSAARGRVVALLDLAPVHLNSKRILHGAVSGTLCDWAGGMAIASTGADRTGVSTDMHVSFVSPAREGDTLEIEAWVTRAGKSLGFTAFEIRKVVPAGSGAKASGAKGPVVASGSHTKYLSFYQPPPSNQSG
ncbi:HotDog domain-containing protein [Lasiosphaeria miniovina]|uniref:HotDog domain-containing protein n=1 Tax=Lasiosphaeria miniovina TaxID=1954250 RepID=A0AA40B4Q5_9PEZI|nr:HotDog domain-containing protein [Lasiosphaeria miniovina]KAK0727569.1 HotDog domain-containing protein [Lasiosphaeria miniovina]